MSKLFVEDCPRCGGCGYVMHGNVTFVRNGREDRHCFQCEGSGKVSFKTSAEQREKNREAARVRREAKRIAEIQAREAKERSENGGYTICELNRMKVEAREKAQQAQAAKSEWLGEVGDKVTLTGTCVFAKTYEGFYGYNTLYIVETEDGSVAKFYTTSQTFNGVGKGMTVEMTGKVKSQDVNEERHGQKITVLERVKCQDHYEIKEVEAA